jgi:hypothetical protein
VKRRALFVLVGSLMAVGVSAGPAQASCVVGYTPEESMAPSFESADLAFVGTVKETTTNPDEVTFDVEDVWKGATPWTTTLRYVQSSDSDFGWSISPGERWLIFAKSGFVFSSCGVGSRLWSADLAQFRPANAHAQPLPPLSIFIFALAICATAGILTVALDGVQPRPRPAR